jgi:hypothetical protein
MGPAPAGPISIRVNILPQHRFCKQHLNVTDIPLGESRLAITKIEFPHPDERL